MNTYFINIGSELASSIPMSRNTYDNSYQQTSMYLYPTDEIEIKNLIKGLNNNKACGFDNISVKMIKLSINEVSSLLTVLINK